MRKPMTMKELYPSSTLSEEQLLANPFLNPRSTGQIDGPTAQLVIDALHTRCLEGTPVHVSTLAGITKLPVRIVTQLLNEMTTSGECAVIKIDEDRFMIGEYGETVH